MADRSGDRLLIKGRVIHEVIVTVHDARRMPTGLMIGLAKRAWGGNDVVNNLWYRHRDQTGDWMARLLEAL